MVLADWNRYFSLWMPLHVLIHTDNIENALHFIRNFLSPNLLLRRSHHQIRRLGLVHRNKFLYTSATNNLQRTLCYGADLPLVVHDEHADVSFLPAGAEVCPVQQTDGKTKYSAPGCRIVHHNAASIGDLPTESSQITSVFEIFRKLPEEVRND